MTLDKNNYDIDNVVCATIVVLCIFLVALLVAVRIADCTVLSDKSMAALCFEAFAFATLSVIGIKSVKEKVQ